jgi:hypothetical protein
MKYAVAVGGLMLALLPMHAVAQGAKVRDAVYRGTLVCDKLPFFETTQREALEVTIAGGDVKYSLVVRERRGVPTSLERGSGKVEGEKISLTGGWSSAADKYEASYSGSFVRRSAKLSGTQSWMHEGKSFTRNCTGVIKRPFAAFLPKDGEKK